MSEWHGAGIEVGSHCGNKAHTIIVPKIVQLDPSIKVVGCMSSKAAEAIRPITAKRSIRRVCVQ